MSDYLRKERVALDTLLNMPDWPPGSVPENTVSVLPNPKRPTLREILAGEPLAVPLERVTTKDVLLTARLVLLHDPEEENANRIEELEHKAALLDRIVRSFDSGANALGMFFLVGLVRKELMCPPPHLKPDGKVRSVNADLYRYVRSTWAGKEQQ